MSAPTVRITGASHQMLKELAERTGEPMTDVLHKALEHLRKEIDKKPEPPTKSDA